MARVSAEILDAMVASGCSAEQIAAVVKAALGSAKSGAERQAAYRARKKADHDESAVTEVTESDESDVTLRNVTNDRNEPSLSPIPLLPPTPPNNPLTPKPSAKKQSRGARLPADATMSGPDLAYALGKGLTETEAEQLFERMCSWAWSASGTNAVKVNWHQAWQGWVQRDGPKIIAARTGRVPGRPLTAYQQSKQETRDILDGLENFARGGGQGGKADFGLLPGDSGERSEGVRSRTGPALIELSAGGDRSSR